jgi:hypothetical protein
MRSNAFVVPLNDKSQVSLLDGRLVVAVATAAAGTVTVTGDVECMGTTEQLQTGSQWRCGALALGLGAQVAHEHDADQCRYHGQNVQKVFHLIGGKAHHGANTTGRSSLQWLSHTTAALVLGQRRAPHARQSSRECE